MASASASTSPCGACKLLRRRCPLDCVFAPHFPAHEPHKFAIVQKVFGASNVHKMLQELREEQRRDAVSSMVIEANARARDPVYGCVGVIASLQQEIQALRKQLADAQAKLLHLRKIATTSLIIVIVFVIFYLKYIFRPPPDPFCFPNMNMNMDMNW